MVFLSETARKKLISIIEKEYSPEEKIFVRFGIKNSGCSGMSYELSFDKIKRKEDMLINEKDKEIKILIDKNSFPYLKNVILEYSDGLNGKGFYFKNPNAKHTCGCGKSFSL